LKTAEAPSQNCHRAGAGAPDGHAKAAQALEGGVAISAGGESADRGLTVGHRREHRVSMRNGLVAGDADAPGGAGLRGNCHEIGRRTEHAPHYSIRTLDGIRFSMLFTRVPRETVAVP